MLAPGARWWPDRRPPRSGLGIPHKMGWGNKQIPNPPSAGPMPGRRDRGWWAPQPGGKVVQGPRGRLQYVPARAEPEGWKEPKKRLQFPLPTPARAKTAAAAANKENALAPSMAGGKPLNASSKEAQPRAIALNAGAPPKKTGLTYGQNPNAAALAALNAGRAPAAGLKPRQATAPAARDNRGRGPSAERQERPPVAAPPAVASPPKEESCIIS